MPIAMALVDIGFTQRRYTIAEHPARICEYDPRLEPALVIFDRGDLVQAFFFKKLRPCIEVAVVDATRIGRLKLNQRAGYILRHVPNPSQSHIGAVRLPKAADRGFGGSGLAAFGAAAAHFEDRALVGGAGDAALDEPADATVFH